MCLEIISPRAPEYLCDPPPVRDADSYKPSRPVSTPASEWQIVLRAAGSDNVLKRYAQELGSAVTRTLEGAGEQQYWLWGLDFAHAVLDRHRNAMVVNNPLVIHNVGSAISAVVRAATGN